MNEWVRLDAFHPPADGVVVAIGAFDGVHIGHREILSEAIRRAAELGAAPVALTFDRHPAGVVSPRGAPPLLDSPRVRFARIRSAGVAECVVAEFDAAFAALPARRFAREVLVERLAARGVVVGFNFKFGRGREGDVEWLAAHAGSLGFQIWSVPPVERGGDVVSSSRIRRLIKGGEVAAAADLLGRPFSSRGRIVSGDRIGRLMGFPTANVQPILDCILPADGIYAGWAAVIDIEADSTSPPTDSRDRVPCAVSVGPRPTFGLAEHRVEAFLLDFEGELYGRTLEIEFVERLRDVESFDGPDALRAQMVRDVEATRRVVGSRPPGIESRVEGE